MTTTKTVMAHRNMVRKFVVRRGDRCSWCGCKPRDNNLGRLWRYGRRRPDGTIGWFVGRYCNSKCRDLKRYENL